MKYALVPVRVPIQANSAAEINRAHELVKGIIEDHLEMDREAWAEDPRGLETAGFEPLTIEVRQPHDAIAVIEE